MQYKKTDDAYIIKIEQKENVVETLTQFCVDHDIKNAHFSGIGAVEFVECGYYALDEKQYHFTKYDQLVEVVSLSGNVMLKDKKPFIHVHGVFTDTSNSAFGGHVVEMRVGVVLEVILTPLISSIAREQEEHIGLALMQCPDN